MTSRRRGWQGGGRAATEQKKEEEEDEKKQQTGGGERDRSPVRDAEAPMESVQSGALQWRHLSAEDLDCTYCAALLPRAAADALLRGLEDEVEYLSGPQARVRVFGRWRDIPRQQAAFGDDGLSYKFSGTTVAARSWPPSLLELRDLVRSIAGVRFNFVLVNRYRDGRDHIGEHRDDEKDLDLEAPIASVSLGQERPFVFRHADARRPRAHPSHRPVPPVRLVLEHGSLLLMNPPTNRFWYHALPPQRARCPGVRLNLTFRKMRAT